MNLSLVESKAIPLSTSSDLTPDSALARGAPSNSPTILEEATSILTILVSMQMLAQMQPSTHSSSLILYCRLPILFLMALSSTTLNSSSTMQSLSLPSVVNMCVPFCVRPHPCLPQRSSSTTSRVSGSSLYTRLSIQVSKQIYPLNSMPPSRNTFSFQGLTDLQVSSTLNGSAVQRRILKCELLYSPQVSNRWLELRKNRPCVQQSLLWGWDAQISMGWLAASTARQMATIM